MGLKDEMSVIQKTKTKSQKKKSQTNNTALQWGDVQQANSTHTKAHSHSILIGGRPLSFWLDRDLAASPKTKNSVLWDPSPTQGRGEHSDMFSTPYNRAF